LSEPLQQHRKNDVGTGPSARDAGGVLTVDLGALAANWRLLRDQAQGAECAAVIKADAYGIGTEPAARALNRAGCTTFFVAQLSEAARARAACRQATIYVLNGLPPGSAASYAALRVRPVLGSREEIEEWAALCRTAGEALPAAIHVDTGMNRLGLRLQEALAFKDDPLLRDFELALVMSHFVSSEVPNDPLNGHQMAAFKAVRAAFLPVAASLCNSSGIFLPQRPHFSLVRPGYALYGGNPKPGLPNPMHSVVRLEARVIQLREVPPGETVGYNGLWTANRNRRLATLSVGYADGYPRAASATDAKAQAGVAAGVALVAGWRCPFAGRVSMDLLSVDVTGVPIDAVKRGDLVTLIGDELTIDDVGARAGTIGYEILTGLGPRYARAYVGGEA
jgi:alanine racemase